MRNRESINYNLDLLESRLHYLQHIVARQEPVEVYFNNINSALELVESIKSYIEDEDISGTELNKIQP